jgi:hypothetical protein
LSAVAGQEGGGGKLGLLKDTVLAGVFDQDIGVDGMHDNLPIDVEATSEQHTSTRR